MGAAGGSRGLGGPGNSGLDPRAAGVPAPCCDCIPTQNRCAIETCPCLAARRICEEHCESARYRGDCLNQAICKCSCEVEEGNAKSAKNACSKAERCDCLRIKEGCSKLCACRQLCKNKEAPKRIAKIAKPTQGRTWLLHHYESLILSILGALQENGFELLPH